MGVDLTVAVLTATQHPPFTHESNVLTLCTIVLSTRRQITPFTCLQNAP